VDTAIEEESSLTRSDHNEKNDGVPDGLRESVEAHPVEPDVHDGTTSIEEVVFLIEDKHLRLSLSTALRCCGTHHYFALVLQSLHGVEHGAA